jgi:hypothetical protein
VGLGSWGCWVREGRDLLQEWKGHDEENFSKIIMSIKYSSKYSQI